MNDKGFNRFPELLKSLLLVFVSLLAVYLFSFLFFGADGPTFLAAFHVIPFIVFFNMSYDDPNNTFIIAAYVLSFIITIVILTSIDWSLLRGWVKKELFRGALIIVLYFIELGLLSSLLLLQ